MNGQDKCMKKLFIYLFSISIAVVTLCMPHKGYSAMISADVPSNSVGIGSVVPVYLIIDAQKQINAVSGIITLGNAFSIESVSDANSIVNFWIEHPKAERSTNKVTFAGIIPGGFEGKASLLRLDVRAKQEGVHDIGLSGADIKVYLNGPDGVQDTATLSDISLSVDDKPASISPGDTELPEHFLISVTQNDLLHEGKWVVIFATQDKQSGIKEYQVAERKGKRVKDYAVLDWKHAESPYVVKDQHLRSFIYVKAIDYAGNERIEVMPPQYPITWYDYIILNLPIVLIFVGALTIIIKVFLRNLHERTFSSSKN